MANPVLKHLRFHDEQAAFDWVEAIVWADGRVCPHCGVVDRSGRISRRTKATKTHSGKPVIGLYKCYACRKPFSVRIGTIFEDSHAEMHLWMQAMYLMCSSKKGFSTNQLARALGVHMKTAWHMTHRIRLAMNDATGGPIGGDGKTIEADETFFGYREGADPWKFTNGHGWQKTTSKSVRNAILTLVERGGRARSIKIDNLRADTLGAAIFGNADLRSHLMTDQGRSYGRIGRRFAKHDSVNHDAEEWVRYEDGLVITVNTAESFFSVFKRGMKGTYQHCAERHLHRYLSEFDFRYNNRIALGVDDEKRTDNLIRGIVGKRLTYRETVDAQKGKTA